MEQIPEYGKSEFKKIREKYKQAWIWQRTTYIFPLSAPKANCAFDYDRYTFSILYYDKKSMVPKLKKMGKITVVPGKIHCGI